MPDCAPASITIGGTLTPRTRIALAEAIEPSQAYISADDRLPDELHLALAYIDEMTAKNDVITLSDDEASWGVFSDLEATCKDLGLIFSRTTSGSAYIDPEVVYFNGKDAVTFAADSDGAVLVPLHEVIAALDGGTIADWIAEKKACVLTVPPLTYDGPPGVHDAVCAECDSMILPTLKGGWEHEDDTVTRKHTPEPALEGAS